MLRLLASASARNLHRASSLSFVERGHSTSVPRTAHKSSPPWRNTLVSSPSSPIADSWSLSENPHSRTFSWASLAAVLGLSAATLLFMEASAAEGEVDLEETVILSTTERERAVNRINKLKGVEGEEETGLVIPNPFIHDTPLTVLESIKLVIGSVTLLPIRVALCIPIIFSSWALAKVAMLGRDPTADALSSLSWWRRVLLRPVLTLNRAFLFVIGFYWIKHHGEPAPPSAAPVIVANCSSPLDSLFLINAFGHIGFIVSPELTQTPILGTLVRAHQCIVVDERVGDERVQRTKILRGRLQDAAADETRTDKPQIAIFPEGVRTNGHYLVTFRPGAFDLGVPVQPVYIDYEYNYFNPALPLVGPSRLEWSIRLLCQLQNKVSLYFVPPLKPSPTEQENPLVFAANVRHLMARRFNLLKTENKVDEVQLIAEAATLGMPPSALRSEMMNLANLSHCSLDDTLSLLRRFNAFDRTESGTLTLQEFSNFLGFPEPNEYTESLFRMMDRDESGDINFREFVFGLSLLSKEVSSEEVIKLAFEAFDDDGNGTISLSDLSKALRSHSKHLRKADVQRMFDAMDTNSDGTITYEDFSKFVRQHPEHDLIRIAKERAIEKQPFTHLKHRRSYWRY